MSTLRPEPPPPTPCRNIRQYPEAAEESGLLLVRLDAPLYFANVQYVRDRLRKYELRSQVSCDDDTAAVAVSVFSGPRFQRCATAAAAGVVC